MENSKVSLEEIKNIIDGFAQNNAALAERIDFVIGVSRGGLIPAALLAARIDKPLVTAYIDKNDVISFDRTEWITGKNILVVDDIIRSGKTLWLLKNYLGENAVPAAISFYALFRVIPLAQPQFHVEAFAKDINCDVIFPWDNN